MTSLKKSKFYFTAAIGNVYAQFAPVTRGLNSAYIMHNNFFEGTSSTHDRMLSLKLLKFNFSAVIRNIDAQFAPVNRRLYSAQFMFQQLFESTSGMR